MHPFRTHHCGEIRKDQVGKIIRLSGWVHRKRDHGNLLFIDLRDHYGISQCVIETGHAGFSAADGARLESVITVTGEVVARSPETVNAELPTGEVEVRIHQMEVISGAAKLPLQVNSDSDYGEEVRLTYRYLDLRREKMHRNITLRANIIASLRRRMTEAGFTEFQTPILTASSPEGARDFLVPSRLNPAKFYALPQAPQLFKQLLMVAGFDRYFQIAPCFRDEDSRADRSPGEFYQLDFEMSFVTQDDVFAAIEPILAGVFEEFAEGRKVTQPPFERIPFATAMEKYGSDKPDLRNPLVLSDVSEIFRESGFGLFAKAVAAGSVVLAVPAPGTAGRPRSFFDRMNEWARGEGAAGLGYVVLEGGEGKGPIAKHLDAGRLNRLREICKAGDGDAVFFVCDRVAPARRFAARVRDRLGADLELIEEDAFRFCWIVDYPMYERDELSGRIEFSHNPFSMPQGGMAALENEDPLEIKAYQYDIVCNGVELSSGAIRNHSLEIMYKAFAIAGYDAATVEKEFAGLLGAFKFGAPPHGGAAPGVDRMVMLLADEPNLREVVAFPMNQNAQDLMMGAPAEVAEERLRELHLRVVMPPQEKKKDGAENA